MAPGRHENPTRPYPRRMESDPASWQNESSVRTVQDPPPPFGSGTPPQPRRGPHFEGSAGQPSPYAMGAETPDSGPRRPGDWRNSGAVRQNSGLTSGTV